MMHFKVIQENKRQVVANELLYQEKRYSIDFIDLEKLAQPENRCLLLCSPHNPTGRVWEQWELERIVSLCQQYDVFYFLMKFIWISLIKAMFIDQLRNLIIKICHYYQWHENL